MSIVSGISTAPGIAPLLNAPRETQQIAPSNGTEPTNRAAAPAAGNVVTLHDRTRPVTGIAREADAGQSVDIRTSSDDRYSRFVKAVQALRIDPTDKILDDRRVAELIDAAEGFFLVDDGVPREVQPLPPDASARIEPLEPEPKPEFPESVIQERLSEAEAKSEEAKRGEEQTARDNTEEDVTTSAPRAASDDAGRVDSGEAQRTEASHNDAARDKKDEAQAAAQQSRANEQAEQDRRTAEATQRREASKAEE